MCYTAQLITQYGMPRTLSQTLGNSPPVCGTINKHRFTIRSIIIRRHERLYDMTNLDRTSSTLNTLALTHRWISRSSIRQISRTRMCFPVAVICSINSFLRRPGHEAWPTLLRKEFRASDNEWVWRKWSPPMCWHVRPPSLVCRLARRWFCAVGISLLGFGWRPQCCADDCAAKTCALAECTRTSQKVDNSHVRIHMYDSNDAPCIPPDIL